MNNTPAQQKSDAEILELTLKDRRFFSLFYKKYFSRIYTYCLTKNNYNRDLTEDIVSTVFMKALEKIDTVVLNKDYDYSLLPWLYTIARNTVLNSWSKQKKDDQGIQYNDDVSSETSLGFEDQDLGSGDSAMSTNPDYDSQIDFEHDSEKLKNAIAQLDEVSKDIVWKRTYDELQFNEIAELLGMQEAAVKMRYYRAIESVTKLVKIC
jgi:RNA polymerase sigma-70 factor (ECF subfamily)